MGNPIDKQREAEQSYWNKTRAEQANNWQIMPDYVQRHLLRPCYEGEGDLYSENRMLFHEIIAQNGGWNEKYVLDYGCGLGNWAIYFGMTGARKVAGFDMSEAGVRLGNERIHALGVDAIVQLHVMDATALTFPNDEFEIVIGNGVLHHTIKYPGIFENLHRVMKPGTKAYFLENLADFPLWRLWWWLKGEVPEGDVPVFSKEVIAKAHMFSDIEIIGDSFVHSAKTFLYRKDMGALRKNILRMTHATDRFLFNRFPRLRKWGCMSVIVLTK